MEKAGKLIGEERFSNLGYPIGMLVSACIELVGSLLYPKNCRSDQFANYMRKYMGAVNRLYKVKFSKQYTSDEGVLRESHISDLLYGCFRSNLAHNANAIYPFPVDAKESTASKHLLMHENGAILIHGYELYRDFMKSLKILYSDLETCAEFNKKVASNIHLFYLKMEKTSSELEQVIHSPAKYSKGSKLKEYPRA